MTLAEQLFINFLLDERYDGIKSSILAKQALCYAEVFEAEKAEMAKLSAEKEPEFDPVEHFLNCLLNSTHKRSHGRV